MNTPAEQPRRLADKAFLGPEFVTWLYFTLIEEDFEIALPEAFTGRGIEQPDDGTVRFAIGSRVQLAAVDAGPRVALTGPGLHDNGETLQAVRRGAMLQVLALQMAVASRVYSFTLNAADGSLSGVSLPDLFSDPDEVDGGQPVGEGMKPKARPRLPFEDVLQLRMECLGEVERIVDCLFQRFIVRRLALAWTEDVGFIQRRVAAGLDARRVPM